MFLHLPNFNEFKVLFLLYLCYNMFMLKPNERYDDLMYKGLKLIQDKDGYCFTQDSVTLSHFVKATNKETIVELGSGSGVISLLLAHKTEACQIIAIELQDRLYDMSKRSVLYNNLENKIKVINERMQDAYKFLGQGVIDVVCVNPPYDKVVKPVPSEKDICRYEIEVTLEEVIISAEKLLKFGGRFYMIHRGERLADIITLLRQYKLEPKRLTPIQPTPKKNVDTIIIEARKGGNPFLRFDKPIIIYDDNGKYTKEAKTIYNISD